MAPQIKLPPGAQLVDDQSSSIKLPPGAELVPETPDFSAGPDNKEGLYEMKGKDGAVKKIPYSKVDAAFKSGLRFDNAAGFRNYAKDKEAEGPGAISRFLSSAGSAIGGAAQSVAGIFNPKPNEYEKSHGMTTVYDAALSPIERLVEPQVQQGEQAVEAAKKDNIFEAAGHGLAAVTPGVGPWAAQVGEQVGGQAGSGNYAGAAGTAFGNALVAVAPKVTGKVVGLVPKAVRGTAEALTKTSPSDLKKFAAETHQANLDAVEAARKVDAGKSATHLRDTQEALHKTEGAELTTEAENKAAVDKAKADHAKAVADTNAHNQRVLDKHKAEVEQITKDNDEAEQAIQQRKAEEAGLQQDTADYYAKEDATNAKVKAAANAKWEPLHEKMQNATVPGEEISQPLEEITAISPEVSRAIRQLTPEPEDAAPDSLFAQDRAQVMKVQGFKGSYFDLPPNLRAQVDAITSSNGFTPDPIDFNPQSGKAIPFETIHRAQSIIGKNIRTGKYGYDGPLLGEMKQLHKVLYQAETRAAMNAGAIDELNAARQATREYHEAFGVERHAPKTVTELRKKQANPEQFKEDSEAERVAAASKHDPSLAEDYEKVKSRREKFKKMKTEDQLRKSQKELPPEPTIDDLRDGYRLKPTPEPKEPVLTQPDRTAPPNRPVEQVPADKWEEYKAQFRQANGREVTPEDAVQIDKTTITPESYKAHKIENIKKGAERVRELGVRRMLNSMFYTAPAVISATIVSTLTGHPGWAISEIGAVPVILASSHAIASLLENKSVVESLSKITPKELKAIDELPPEDKAVFSENLRNLAKQAQKKGATLSPALSAFIGGTAATQGKKKDSLSDLKKQAEELYNQFHGSGYAPAPSGTGPQSSAKGYTHVGNNILD